MKTAVARWYRGVGRLIMTVGAMAILANAQDKPIEAPATRTVENARAVFLLPGEGRAEGDENRWKVTAAETSGAYSLRYSERGPGGPELHTHTKEDEAWYILEGELSFEVSGRTVMGPQGSFLFAPRGAQHRYWNSGERTAKYLIMFSPGGFEKYLEERRAIPGRDPSKSLSEQSPEWQEKADALRKKYGLLGASAAAGTGQALLIPPRNAADDSAANRVIVSNKDTFGAFSMAECTLKPDNVGESLEGKEDAGWYVIDGELTFGLGDRAVVASKGAFVFLPRGINPRYWASGKTHTRYLLIRSSGQ